MKLQEKTRSSKYALAMATPRNVSIGYLVREGIIIAITSESDEKMKCIYEYRIQPIRTYPHFSNPFPSMGLPWRIM